MKNVSEKKTNTALSTPTRTTKEPFIGKAGEGNFFEASKPMNVPVIQTKSIINGPGDSYEQEADKKADQVMRKDGDAPETDAKESQQPNNDLNSTNGEPTVLPEVIISAGIKSADEIIGMIKTLQTELMSSTSSEREKQIVEGNPKN